MTATPAILFITVCESHYACPEVSSKPNKKDGDQTCKKSGCFYTRKPCLNYSFQKEDTQGFQNILAMCLLMPEQQRFYYILRPIKLNRCCQVDCM